MIKTLLIALGVFIISSSISYLFFSKSSTFISSLEEIAKKMSDGSLTSAMYKEYLFANNNELLNYLLSVMLPTIFIAAIFFIYLISKSSLSVYLKLETPKLTSQFAHLSLKRFIKDNRKDFYKVCFVSNLPLYILFIGGLVLGSSLSYGLYNYPLAPIPIGIASAFALTGLYFPFYLNNMETIYELFSPQIHLSVAKSADEIMERFARLNAMKEEDKKKIDDFLNSLKEKDQQQTDINQDDKEK